MPTASKTTPTLVSVFPLMDLLSEDPFKNLFQSQKVAAYSVGIISLISMLITDWKYGTIIQSFKRNALGASWGQMLILLISMISAACGMEFYARYAHGNSWHNESSRLYEIHMTHHGKKSKDDLFESNDYLGIMNFFLVIGPLIWSAIVPPTYGTMALLGLCIGISIFGVSYAIVHDGIHHRRFPVYGLDQIPCLRRIADAHGKHHTSTLGPPFGMFLGPQELEAAAAGVPPAPIPRYLIASLIVCSATTVLGLVFGF